MIATQLSSVGELWGDWKRSPTAWKQAKFSHIFKKGKKKNEEFQVISLLSVPREIIMSFLWEFICSHIRKRLLAMVSASLQR